MASLETETCRARRRRGWVAFALAWLGPGYGYIHLGRPDLALGLYAALHAVNGGIRYGPAGRFSTCVACILLGVGLVAASALDAKRRALAAPPGLKAWYRRWVWVLPLLLADVLLLPRLLPWLEEGDRPALLPPPPYTLAHATSGSMLPTLHPGDVVVCEARVGAAGLRRGEVIVFFRPEPGGPPLWAKRCVALAGDQVEIRDGRLWIHGQDGGPCPFPREDGPPRRRLGPLVVPPGHVYCLGDNRDNSYDSRAWGPLPEEAIRGRVRYTLWPGSGGLKARWRRLGRTIETPETLR